MKTTKKNLPKSHLEITVELEPKEIEPYIVKAAVKISHEVKIPGFRSGHVPNHILNKYVGEATIYEEAFPDIVNKTLGDIIIKDEINFVGQPKVEPEKIAPGNPLIYKAVLALMPVVTLGNYKQLKAKKKSVVIDEKKVQKTFSDLQNMQAKEKLVDRLARKDDKVEINFTIKIAGVIIEGGQATKYPLIIGENKFIPGFEENLIGMKKEEKKNFPLTFPKDYFDKKLADRKTDVEVTLLAVYERSLPKLDDAFAQNLNFKTWAELEKQIRSNIQKELETKEEERLELSILEEISDHSTFSDFPDEIIDLELTKMWHELKANVEDAGGKIDDYLTHLKKSEDDIKKELKPQAEKRIKTALVAQAVQTAEKIEVPDKEIHKEIEKNLKAYSQYPEMQKKLTSKEYHHYIENLLSNRKTLERLKSFIAK